MPQPTKSMKKDGLMRKLKSLHLSTLSLRLQFREAGKCQEITPWLLPTSTMIKDLGLASLTLLRLCMRTHHSLKTRSRSFRENMYNRQEITCHRRINTWVDTSLNHLNLNLLLHRLLYKIPSPPQNFRQY